MYAGAHLNCGDVPLSIILNFRVRGVYINSNRGAYFITYALAREIYFSQKQPPRKLKTRLVITVRGLYFLAVVFAATIYFIIFVDPCT